MEKMVSSMISVEKFIGDKEYFIRKQDGQNYEIYNDKTLFIPSYQREIKWDEKNIQILVDDLCNQETHKYKYLGNIILSSEDSKKYNIIDGQQRLTAIFMLVKAINKHYEDKIECCSFINGSFDGFIEAIDKDFYKGENENRKECEKKDRLNQLEHFERLWTYTNKLVDELNEKGELDSFKERLLDSEFNIIIQPISDKRDEKRICVDYFIDINNKNVSLEWLDILKAYAFKAEFEATIDKWIGIQKKLKDDEDLFYYPMEHMLRHYVLCTINYEVKNLKGITDDLKISSEVKIGNKIYEKDTDIELLITNTNYYTHMLDLINSLIKFIEVIFNAGEAHTKEFDLYINPSDKKLHGNTRQNIFTIINGIIRSSDIVPRILLMKYYVDVIKNPSATSDDYDLIYPIGLLSTMFSAGKGDKKNRKEFSSIVLKNNWKEMLKKKAKTKYKSVGLVQFGKEIKYKNAYNETCGQFLNRRVHALLSTVNNSNYNPEKFFNYNHSKNYNDEHFFINQKYKIEYNIKKNNYIYEYPEKICSRISNLGNYLIIDSKTNNKLGNKTIKEKFIILEKEIASGKDVFKDKLSEIKYNTAKEIFRNGSCPSHGELKKCNSEEEAKEKLSLYYETHFEEEYNRYCSELQNILKEYSLANNQLLVD